MNFEDNADLSEQISMQRLMDTEQWDELVRRVTPEIVAKGWLGYHSRGGTLTWAWDLLVDPPRELPISVDFRRAVTDLLVEQAPIELLPAVAAGPLEGTFFDDEVCVKWIEERCRESERMRETLRHAWFRNHVSRKTYERLRAAAGGPLSDEGSERSHKSAFLEMIKLRYKLAEWIVLPTVAVFVAVSTILFFDRALVGIVLSTLITIRSTWSGARDLAYPRNKIVTGLLILAPLVATSILLLGAG